MSLTKATYSMILGAELNVLDFGADPTGVNSSSSAIQAAVDVAAAQGRGVFIPSGVYKLTAALDFDNAQGMCFRGEARPCLNGSGTGFQAYGTRFNFTLATGSAFINLGASNAFSDFSVTNTSGGSTESCFYGSNTFNEYKRLGIYGFNYGFNFEKTVYLTFDQLIIRNCTYGISCWQITGTAPFILNDNYFNNVINVSNCQVIGGDVCYSFIGANINLINCDASSYAVYGFHIGEAIYPLTTFNADLLYAEGSSTDVMKVYNAKGTIGTMFLGGTDTNGILSYASNVSVDTINSYGTIVNGVNATTSSYVNIVTAVTGGISFAFVQDGTSVVRQLYKEGTNNFASVTLNNTQSTTIVVNGATTRHYSFDIYGSDNGVSNYAFRVLQVGPTAYIIGTKPTNLTVTSTINVNGNYDLVLTNSTGSPYTYTVASDYRVSNYSVTL